LVADAVHSMDIAAAVGSERLREIMTQLVGRAREVVQRYDGTVDKFTGDGIMAVFGAPVALEDHAVRACMAALGVQDEAKQIAVTVGERDGVDLQVRVGLNSGEVIAGEIGSGALGYTAVGEQVGMAQRMESAAPPGGATLSASRARTTAAPSTPSCRYGSAPRVVHGRAPLFEYCSTHTSGPQVSHSNVAGLRVVGAGSRGDGGCGAR
jgi:adenylate cyclase